MSVALWPVELPLPQVESQTIMPPAYCDPLDVLSGPTRVRLARRNAAPTFDFQIFFTADQAEFFEGWYWGVTEANNGEMYLPWIGGGRVVAFADEYQLAPLGLGWSLQGMVLQTRIDSSLCDAHIGAEFGLLRDSSWTLPDNVIDDGLAADIWRDDFDLALFEPC